MAGARWIENPAFMPSLEDAIADALDQAGEEIVSKAKAGIQSTSSSAAAAVTAEPAARGTGGPTKVVKMGPGLGRIFEFFKGRNRVTRSGANRGVIRRVEFFHRAKDEVVQRGLHLGRFL